MKTITSVDEVEIVALEPLTDRDRNTTIQVGETAALPRENAAILVSMHLAQYARPESSKEK